MTRDTWDDFARLFGERGAPHYCWCGIHRFQDAHRLDGEAKRARMHALVENAVPIGVLAYDGDRPVGWCSVAPRESYVRLERSRTMPRATAPGTRTWTVLCFFVARPYRGRSVARTLLLGAVDYARAQGAEVVEGYPFDTAGISSTHRGHSSVFGSAGFRQDGRRWFLDLPRT